MAKKSRFPVDELPADVLQRIAHHLHQWDRHKLNLVCKTWRDSLLMAPQLWATALIDSRQKVRTSRRRPLKKKGLPTPDALLAYFRTYGSQVQKVTFSNLDETAHQAGCLGAHDVAAIVHAAGPALKSVSFVDCCLPVLLGQPLEALAQLPQLQQLELRLPDLEHPWTAAAFDCLCSLTALQELRLEAAPPHRQWLPAGFSALTSLRSLAVSTPLRAEMVLPRELSALAPCLQHLSIENHVLLSPHSEVSHAHLICADQVCCFTQLTSLRLSQCELGTQLYAANLRGGACGLPPGLTALTALQKLELLRHKLSARELDTIAQLTALTSLSLTAEHSRHAISSRRVPHEVPLSFSKLTGLRQLTLQHGLQQIPPAILELTQLTELDLSFNRLHTLKPGPFLRHLEIIKLGANVYKGFPRQLGAARDSLRQIHLFMNSKLELSEKDVSLLAAFSQLRWLVMYGAQDSRQTKRSLQLMAKAMPWVQVDA